MYKVISVKNAHGVILAFHFEQTVKHPVHGIAFALFGVVKTLMHLRTSFACHFSSFVGAVVGNDIYVDKLRRIILIPDAVDKGADDLFLIARGDKYRNVRTLRFFVWLCFP